MDRWAECHNLNFSRSEFFDYCVFRQAVAIKPRTYMNLSGNALKAAMLKWKIEETMVLHDDIELPRAQLRVRSGGGDGGHNGLKSLFEVLPPADIKRIRIGIGRHPVFPAEKYVLDEFEPDEFAEYDDTLDLVCRFVDVFVRSDFKTVLNEYSTWKKSYSDGKNIGITSPKEEKG